MLLLLAAFNDAFGIVVDKLVLTKGRVSVVIFTIVQFFFLTTLAALTLPFLGRIDPTAFSLVNLGLLIIMISLAATWNLMYYKSIQEETVERLEVMLLTYPLFTIGVSAIFFAQERHFYTLMAAVIASLALILAHLDRNKIRFDRYELVLILAVMLMAVEAVIIKLLVQIWSPAALYTVRTLAVFLVLLAATRPTVKGVKLSTMVLIFTTGVAGVIYKIIQFTGFERFGIVYTTLILILSPVFVLMLDRVILHEKIHLKQVVAMVVIVGAVVWGTIAR